jgi:putative ABC transport system permease protein
MNQQPTGLYPRLFRLAWRNVVRNWRHSFATLLAIASGFMAVSLFDGFLKELEARNLDGFTTRGMFGQVIIERHNAQELMAEDMWANSLSAEDQKFIEPYLKNSPLVDTRVRFLTIVGMASTPTHNAVVSGIGYDLAEGAKVRGERWQWNAYAGQPLHLADKHSVALGVSLGHLLECETPVVRDFVLDDGNFKPEVRPFTCAHNRVIISATTEAAQVNALDMPISGFIDAGFREIDKRALNMSVEDAWKLLDTDKLTMVAVTLKNPNDTKKFVADMSNAAKAAGLNIDILPWEQHKAAAYVQGGIEILGVFRNLFMCIVVAICVMSVANTMMKSVNERIREIGTLRSLGFFKTHLVFVFSAEGMILSFIACWLGLILTLGISFAIGKIGLTYKAGILSIPIVLRVKYVPEAWLVSAVVLMVLATATAWFCSKRASSMVIADAMRHV